MSNTPSNTKRGALLIHGFTAGPDEMAPLGEYLRSRGFTVALPLLPGHGTKPGDLDHDLNEAWCLHVDREFKKLQSEVSEIYVCGLSMGGILALYLGTLHPEIKAIASYSTPYWLKSRTYHLAMTVIDRLGLWQKIFPASFKKGPRTNYPIERFAYDCYPALGLRSLVRLVNDVRGTLSQVSSPVVLFHSVRDQVIPYASMKLISRRLSGESSLITLNQSHHVLTCDVERERVFSQTLLFFNEAAHE